MPSNVRSSRRRCGYARETPRKRGARYKVRRRRWIAVGPGPSESNKLVTCAMRVMKSSVVSEVKVRGICTLKKSQFDSIVKCCLNQYSNN